LNKEVVEEFVVSGIALNETEAKITIRGVPDKPGMAGFIFTRLAEGEINVDMIVQSSKKQGKNDISFTVEKRDLEEGKRIMEGIRQELGVKEVIYDSDIAKVSIVGAGMQSHPGVAARMFACLGREKINIDMISTSEIKVSCVVKKENGRKAVRAIHREFDLGKEKHVG